MSGTPEAPAGHRAGFVALLGPPNAGKSTLLNRLVGEKLAIVSPRPQTTRSRILGIVGRPAAQIALVDTPGLHESTRQLGAALNEAVAEAAQDCDVALLLVDGERGWEPAHDGLLAQVRARRVPLIVAVNKIDRVAEREAVRADAAERTGQAPWLVSAQTGEGIPALLDALEAALPESPPLWPEDTLTDRPVRWLCAELIREAAFACLDQEVPYSVAVEVVRFDESRPGLVRIDANVLVARAAHKRIVVGAGGRTVKAIGTRARRSIEALLDGRVHLALFVKVDPLWPKSPRRIEELGYR